MHQQPIQTRQSEVSVLFAEPEFAVQLREDLPMADVCHVLDLFAVDLNRLAAALHNAVQTGPRAALHRPAHALAGAAGAVGACNLEIACRAVMHAAHDESIDLADALHAVAAAAASAELALARVQGELLSTSAATSGGRV